MSAEKLKSDKHPVSKQDNWSRRNDLQSNLGQL